MAIEVLLGHPEGPFWRKKDQGSWSIPKELIRTKPRLPRQSASSL